MKKSLGPNTLAQPTPVWLVGAFDEAGQPNLATVAWGGICCSKPPCVSVALRPATHSHDSILDRKAFTVNVATEGFARQADFCGIASGRDTDKFAATGLTPVKSELVDAPYVEQFPLILECRLQQSVAVGGHTLFIGEIMDVKADKSVLSPEGYPHIEKVRPIIFTPVLRNYHGVGGYLGQAFSIGKELK
ncbi:flavin reductase family protein [Syntrophotalea acetylenica]|uniref:Flavoredoxin n=1 Tax=Syntrophotalea acetylenica TaxID=29542 RepID=A0A1L3GFM0_SYNAC|nr:flavin reductase family protein [Syntrophotalea acetylenica]APG24680.1 flavoredoxin [Syntrophotalea acetylenica]